MSNKYSVDSNDDVLYNSETELQIIHIAAILPSHLDLANKKPGQVLKMSRTNDDHLL